MLVPVPESFAAMPRWWSDDAGRAWLDTLPEEVAQRCVAWGLTVTGTPWHGSNALVVPVERAGAALALRLSPPGDDVGAAVRALRHWAGRGVVGLVDADADAAGGAMLLQRLDGDRTLGAVPVAESVEVLGGLARTLAVPAPADVTCTRDLAAAAVEELPRAWAEQGAPGPRRHLDAAVAAARELAAAVSEDLSVDGDLHAEQVLADGAGGWVVVDPVLLRGDPEHDAARTLWTRLDELPGEREIRAALAGFVAAAGVPAERARAWVLVRALEYQLWGLARGLTIDPPRCARLLATFV